MVPIDFELNNESLVPNEQIIFLQSSKLSARNELEILQMHWKQVFTYDSCDIIVLTRQ